MQVEFNDNVHESVKIRLESDLNKGSSLGTGLFVKGVTISLIIIPKPVSKRFSNMYRKHS